MTEIFLELIKNVIHRFVQEVQHFPSGTLFFLSLHIMLIYHNGTSEHQKIMKKNIKTPEEKRQALFKWAIVRLADGFSKGTIEAKQQWNDSFNGRKPNNCPPKIIYPPKSSLWKWKKNFGQKSVFITSWLAVNSKGYVSGKEKETQIEG